MEYQDEIAWRNAVIVKQQELISLLMTRPGNPIPGMEMPNEALISTAEQSIAPHLTDKITFDKNGFETFLKNKSLSQNSVDTYITGMKLFFDEYDELNESTARAFNDKVIKKYKPKSANVKISALSHYFEFVGMDMPLRRVRDEKSFFRDNVISDKEYAKLTDWARENSPKDYLICAVLAHTGMRVSELLGVKQSDFLRGEVYLVSKANHARTVFFTESLIEDVKPYLDEDSEWLVPNENTKKPMTSRGVTERLKRAAEKADVNPEVVYPHSFRHYFAKKFLEKNNDMSLLADLLGHCNLATTMIYTRKSKAEQIKLLEKTVKW